MDRAHHEMQFMGLFRIYGESLKLTFILRKIFSQITLTLVLPLVLIIFANEYVSDILQYKIFRNKFDLMESRPGTRQRHNISDLLTFERAAYYLTEILYFTFVLGFSLLSTSAVVYTIASFYTSKEITYRRIMSVVPKVWKRLIVTLFCAFLTFLAWFFAFMLTLNIWNKAYNVIDNGQGDDDQDDTKSGAVLLAVLIVYGAVFVYMAMLWQIASVISVMEDVKGFKAVLKGVRLVKGKAVVCVIVSVKLIVVLVGVYLVYVLYANGPMTNEWEDDDHSISSRDLWKAVVVYGGSCVLVLMATILFEMVVQTVIYMVCKSCHHETIDKLALANHLESIYLGEYVPLQGGETTQIEMGEYGA